MDVAEGLLFVAVILVAVSVVWTGMQLRKIEAAIREMGLCTSLPWVPYVVGH